MEFQNAVVIGRFQPFHNSHLELVQAALKLAPKVTIVVGSSFAAPTIKNPWSFEERKAMIESCFTDAELRNIKIVGVRDYYYNMNTWLADVQAKVAIPEGQSVALVGSYKDGSSFYLRSFPQWTFVATKTKNLDLDSSLIREKLLTTKFQGDYKGEVSAVLHDEKLEPILQVLPLVTPVVDHIRKWVRQPIFVDLTKEYDFIKKYRESWDSAPYPPTFVCSDAIVTCSGHVLVVKRKINPGKGLFALPGGFVNQTETIKSGMIRELKEETGIRVDSLILESSIVSTQVFDHPDRSLRGRTISHGFHIKLKDGPLPEVHGGDDALIATWMPVSDVGRYSDKFFEDHFSIITHFTNQS